MLLDTMKELYQRDLQKLKRELNLYQSESTMWIIKEDIKNSGGNLALHLIGNLKTYIGAGLAKYDYERKREHEFSAKGIPRTQIIAEIDETISIVLKGLDCIDEGQMNDDYPVIIWDKPKSMIFTLLHLHSHLNFHLGQISYHRRLLDHN